jgi:hypothetical protein
VLSGSGLTSKLKQWKNTNGNKHKQKMNLRITPGKEKKRINTNYQNKNIGKSMVFCLNKWFSNQDDAHAKEKCITISHSPSKTGTCTRLKNEKLHKIKVPDEKACVFKKNMAK